MQAYRLYHFDGADRITSAEWIEATNDAEALFIASSNGSGVTREVWHRERLVGRVGSEPSAPSLLS